MENLKKFISTQISQIVPRFETLEVSVLVGDSSYSVEFFATIDNKKWQCMQMVDEGLIKEKDFDDFAEKIADFVRDMPEYQAGKVNTFSVVIE